MIRLPASPFDVELLDGDTVDGAQTITDDNVPFAAPFLQRCNGFAERTFTYVKRTDGTLEPESMTGPQRRRRG